MRAALSIDGASILIIGQRWRQKISAAELPEHLAFYRKLRDRDAPRDKAGKITSNGPYHQFHTQTVEQLEAVERKIKEAGKT